MRSIPDRSGLGLAVSDRHRQGRDRTAVAPGRATRGVGEAGDLHRLDGKDEVAAEAVSETSHSLGCDGTVSESGSRGWGSLARGSPRALGSTRGGREKRPRLIRVGPGAVGLGWVTAGEGRERSTLQRPPRSRPICGGGEAGSVLGMLEQPCVPGLDDSCEDVVLGAAPDARRSSSRWTPKRADHLPPVSWVESASRIEPPLARFRGDHHRSPKDDRVGASTASLDWLSSVPTASGSGAGPFTSASLEWRRSPVRLREEGQRAEAPKTAFSG